MPRCRAPVRRGDARAAIFIILGFGLFAMVGLILAIVMLTSVRRTPAKTAPFAPRPISERFGGLLCYCPPGAESVTAVDVKALTSDPAGNEIAEVLSRVWLSSREVQLGKVALTIADVDAFIAVARSEDRDVLRGLGPQNRRGVLTAIRFNRPVTEGEILRQIVSGKFQSVNRIAPNGEHYHTLLETVKLVPDNREWRADDLSLRMADDRTLLITISRPEMEESFRRAPGRFELGGTLLEMIEKSEGTVISAVFAPTGLWPPLDPPFLSTRTPAGKMADKRRAGSVWFAINGDQVEYHESFLMPDAPAAAALRESLITEYLKGAPPPPASETLTDFIAAARVSAKSDFVTVEVSVDRERFVKALKDELGWREPKKK